MATSESLASHFGKQQQIQLARENEDDPNGLRGGPAVKKLIDSIPLADQFALAILGPILSGLRDAEQELKLFS